MKAEAPKWRRVEISKGHFIETRSIDPKIQAQMPETSKTFVQVGPIELIIHDIKKALHPNEEIPF